MRPALGSRGRAAARELRARRSRRLAAAPRSGIRARRCCAGTALPSPDSLPDAVITARIKAAILTDPALAGADISVNTDNRVVSLVGTVLSQEQAAIASAHAQGEDGVMRIDNHLAFNLQ